MKDFLSQTIPFSGDPTALLKAFEDQPYCFLLDSSLSGEQDGRYSYFGCDPFKVYQHKALDHFDQLKKEFQPYYFNQQAEIFAGGIVGFIGYDHGLYQENIELHSRDDYDLPDCVFGFYDCTVSIDHLRNEMTIYSTGFPETEEHNRERRAISRLNSMIERMKTIESQVDENLISHSPTMESPLKLQSELSPTQYCQLVEKALDHIDRGDIYQVNLSQRFDLLNEPSIDPVILFSYLRRLSPSRYGVYFNGGDYQIISSSPERYLKLKGQTLLTQPMKGTRPRGDTFEEDVRLMNELQCSSKDIAELLMITDLERNDLGRVCQFGSVHVREMRQIERYSTVFQATSTIEGQLKKEKDQFDVLKACFPGGSITGCPKIKAMQIIEDLEPSRRSIYTGSFGYISFHGAMDFNILIRTILSKNHNFYFQVGSGIVSDSTPQGEYEESIVKSRAMQACLNAALNHSKSLHNVS